MCLRGITMAVCKVDNNVTRHLDKELSEKSEWDAMFLHYLGLDHIGHIAGPSSPLVAPKLREMDNVIEKVFQYLSRRVGIYIIQNWN